MDQPTQELHLRRAGRRRRRCGRLGRSTAGARNYRDVAFAIAPRSCELAIPFAKSTCPVAAFVMAAARRSRQCRQFAGRRFRASTITSCVGTDGIDGRPRPRSPDCRLARGSGRLIAAGTRAAPTRPQQGPASRCSAPMLPDLDAEALSPRRPRRRPLSHSGGPTVWLRPGRELPTAQKRHRRGVLLLRHRNPAPSERAVWNNSLSRCSASARHTPIAASEPPRRPPGCPS